MDISSQMADEERETLAELASDLRSKAKMHCYAYVENAKKDRKDMMRYCRRIAEYCANQANTLRKALSLAGFQGLGEPIDVDECIRSFETQHGG